MNRIALLAGAAALIGLTARPATAQTFPTSDPVLERIWEQGMDNSLTYPLAQALLDSIGPRLTGTPGFFAAVDWVLNRYEEWGIEARREQYGTWNGWERGITHMDLLTPRVRTLEATMLAWSPPTDGWVRGPAVVAPTAASMQEFVRWLPNARGAYVLVSPPEPTCRPDQNWEALATPESFERMSEERDAARRTWGRSVLGGRAREDIIAALEETGALGIVTSRWSAGWGVNKIFSAFSDEIPTVDLSCEDYGLVHRLAANGQGPVVRLQTEAQFMGEVPAFNVVAEIPGTERPDEYVMLSAHLDSWDGASGATDNGTGTIMMLEAMRLLKDAYPNPKRTILVGHWGGEELGLVGSTAFAYDHPDVVNNLQVLFNQDNGTWRVEYIKMQGLADAAGNFTKWFARLPEEIKTHIELDLPGLPERGGSDHMSFLCSGAPGFRLQSHYPDYRQYTWHTNRDTFDKLIFDDLKNNATLAAMLAYLASEDPDRVPRTQIDLPKDSRGRQMTWPECRPPRRSP